jgi:hypothetical protein
MLAVSVHEHSGLGNQIWRAVCCRVFADRLGYDYAISHPGWRGPFLNFDFGKEINLNVENESDFYSAEELPEGIKFYYEETTVTHNNPFFFPESDPDEKKFLTIEDETYINGNFQILNYIEEYRDKICDWLTYDDKYKVTDYSSENICVIQIRGGDYKTGHSVLPQQYYYEAMRHMKDNNPNIEFVIVTDDPEFSKQMIPNVEIVGSAVSDEKDLYQKNIGWYTYPGGPVHLDYSILNTAKYAIISASTFAFWPIWTNKYLINVIAPKYWFDWSRSDSSWRPTDSIVNDEKWLWLDREGYLYRSDTCINEAKSNKKDYRH